MWLWHASLSNISKATPSTLTTYKLPLVAGPNAPYATPLQFETFYMAAPGPDVRQKNGPHPHQTLLDPTGKFLLVPDLGADAIHVFAINTASGHLNACPGAITGPGDGPRHGAWWSPHGNTSSTDGLRLYIVNKLGTRFQAGLLHTVVDV
jgi:hypothetical protein